MIIVPEHPTDGYQSDHILAKEREAVRIRRIRDSLPIAWTMAIVFALLSACGSCGSHPTSPPDAHPSPGTCCALAPDGSAVVHCVCATYGQPGIMDSCAGHPDSTTCVLGVACGSAFYPGGCP